MTEILNDSNFDSWIADSKKPVLVDFFNDGCVPCRRVAPILSKTEKAYEEKVAFAKVKIAMNPETVQKYEVEAAPTLILFKNGTEVARHRGVATADQITALVKQAL